MLTLHAFDPHGIMTRARSIHLPPQRILSKHCSQSQILALANIAQIRQSRPGFCFQTKVISNLLRYSLFAPEPSTPRSRAEQDADAARLRPARHVGHVHALPYAVYIYLYIYIHIYHIYICIYIYIYTCVCVCVYIYRDADAERLRPTQSKMLTLHAFDSHGTMVTCTRCNKNKLEFGFKCKCTSATKAWRQVRFGTR